MYDNKEETAIYRFGEGNSLGSRWTLQVISGKRSNWDCLSVTGLSLECLPMNCPLESGRRLIVINGIDAITHLRCFSIHWIGGCFS